MGLDQSPYADVVEVRHCGRRRANIYLANGWTLIDARGEQRIQQRPGLKDESGEPTTMWIKVEEITYILGRTEDVEFEGDDVERVEKEARQLRREAETERAAKAVEDGSAVEEPSSSVTEAVDRAREGRPPLDEPTGRIQPADCKHDWVDALPPRRSCAKCGTPEPLIPPFEEIMTLGRQSLGQTL